MADVETKLLKQQFQNIKESLDDFKINNKEDFKELKNQIQEILSTINNTLPSLRSDINQSMSKSTDNGIRITKIELSVEDHGKRLAFIETTGKSYKGFWLIIAGIIGTIGGVISIIKSFL